MSQEPVPVIALEYAQPREGGSPTWRRIVRVTHWVALLSCAAGVVVIGGITTRYGVLVALVVAPAGVLLTIGGGIIRDAPSVTLGLGHAGICVLFFVLVNLLGWGPAEAGMPMTIMGGLCRVLAVCLARGWCVLWRVVGSVWKKSDA